MKLSVKETAVFGMLGAMMFASKMVTELLPNIHLIGVFIVAITLVFRAKALYPLYVFILITGFYAGFAAWWLPYLYIWAVLWGFAMLIPQKIPKKTLPIVCMAVCSLHGFLYGTLYAPAQALLFGLDFKGMITWIIAGFPFDLIHGVSNFFCGMLIVPIAAVLKTANRYISKT